MLLSVNAGVGGLVLGVGSNWCRRDIALFSPGLLVCPPQFPPFSLDLPCPTPSSSFLLCGCLERNVMNGQQAVKGKVFPGDER